MNLQRTREIVQRNAGTELELRERQAQHDQALANVELADAALVEAQLNLDYATIEAPFAGHVGRNLVDRGALVNATTVLTTIVNDEEIFVYFEASETQHLEYMTLFPQARQATGGARNAELRLDMRLANEPEFTHEGRVNWADNQVDADTGTIRVRGVFPNPERRMIPGLLARVRLAKGPAVEGLLVPEVALGRDQTGAYVLVVGEGNKIERRTVALGQPTAGCGC